MCVQTLCFELIDNTLPNQWHRHTNASWSFIFHPILYTAVLASSEWPLRDKYILMALNLLLSYSHFQFHRRPVMFGILVNLPPKESSFLHISAGVGSRENPPLRADKFSTGGCTKSLI